MSQRGVERALGKMVTDNRFRKEFFGDPAVASRNAGLELTAAEIDALLRVPRCALDSFEECIDDRICRMDIPEGGRTR